MDDTKQIVAHVNKKLKDDFKMACIRRGESQREAINRLAKYYIDTDGNLKSE